MNQGKAQDFATLEKREKIIQEIDNYMTKYGNPAGTNQSSVEIESQIHQKARNREEYMNLIARFLIHLKDVTGASNNMGNVGPAQKGIVPQVVAQTVMGTHDDDERSKLVQQIQMPGQQRVQMLQVSNPAQIQTQQLLPQTTPMANFSKAAQLTGMQNLINTAHLGNLQQASNVSLFQGAHGIQASQGLSAQISGGINVNQPSAVSYQEQVKQIQARKVQQIPPSQQQNKQPQPQQKISRTVPNKSPVMNQNAGTPQPPYAIPTQKSHPSPSPSQSNQGYPTRPDPSPASSGAIVVQSPLATQPSPSPAAATPGNPASWGGGPAPSPLDASEESAYSEKLKELAKYIEPLRSLINKMPKDGEHATKIKKLQYIEEILTNKRRVNLTVLTKCERVAHTLLSSDTGTVNPKPSMLQTVTDHLVPLAANPSLVTAAHQCIHPVQRTLTTPTIKQPKPPRKRRRPSSDDEESSSNLPDALQMEIAHLWNRFTFDLDSTSKMDKSFFTISCRTKKSGLPSLPPLVIRVPASYPKRMPEYSSINTDNSENLLVDRVKKNFLSQLLESQKEQFHSVTYILEAWEKSLQETLSK